MEEVTKYTGLRTEIFVVKLLVWWNRRRIS